MFYIKSNNGILDLCLTLNELVPNLNDCFKGN